MRPTGPFPPFEGSNYMHLRNVDSRLVALPS